MADASPAVSLVDLTGDALTQALDALAGLRITVFRAFPYLYTGDPAYEHSYLTRYGESRNALIAGAFAGDRPVGAATAAPLAEQEEALTARFADHGIAVDQTCYFGESVLLSEWRGHGIGHAFFDRREAHARSLGLTIASFCAVVRATDHPARPQDYSPLDSFWRKRGYVPIEGLTGNMDWKDIGAAEETPHCMQFWVKRL